MNLLEKPVLILCSNKNGPNSSVQPQKRFRLFFFVSPNSPFVVERSK